MKLKNDEMEQDIAFVQAEFSNVDTEDDSGNAWKWKKGEKLHRWTTGKYYVIVRIQKYPGCGIVLKEVKE
jgi:hypothetical protein